MNDQAVAYHLRCVMRALEDAQRCICGDPPEDCSPQEQARDALVLVRAALTKHIPEIRKELQDVC